MVNDDNLISDQITSTTASDEKAVENVSEDSAQGKEENVGFRELYEQSLQSVQMGGVLTGRVVQINADTIMVDVGWKTEGYIPARELRDEQDRERAAAPLRVPRNAVIIDSTDKTIPQVISIMMGIVEEHWPRPPATAEK